MRTIVVPTDFSEPARTAAEYALHLAHALKSNLELCHAFNIPIEEPMFGQTAWALYEYPVLKKEYEDELKKEVKNIESEEKKIWGEDAFPFHPSIYYACETGDPIRLINDTAARNRTLLVVMGMKGASNLARFLLGSNSIKMIEHTEYPLLLIPSGYQYKDLKKIAFATDLNVQDIKISHTLIKFADYFNAELLITHITDTAVDLIENISYQQKKDTFFKDLEGKICYNYIESDSIDTGLNILKDKNIDMLVMGHQQKGFIRRLIAGSHAARQAQDLQIPLLIIPEGGHIYF